MEVKVPPRIAVHLSLISRGRSLLDSFLLLKPEENEGQSKGRWIESRLVPSRVA